MESVTLSWVVNYDSLLTVSVDDLMSIRCLLDVYEMSDVCSFISFLQSIFGCLKRSSFGFHRSVRCSAAECDVLARLCVVRGKPKPMGWLGTLSQSLGTLGDLRGLGSGRSVNLCENIVRAQFQKDRASFFSRKDVGTW